MPVLFGRVPDLAFYQGDFTECVDKIEEAHQKVVDQMEWYARVKGVIREDFDYDNVSCDIMRITLHRLTDSAH